MTATPLGIPGAYLISGARHVDSRGAFRRVTEMTSLRRLGFDVENAELSFAQNVKAGTVRGLHYQKLPHQERKLVWCVAGAAFDVLVDLRPDSEAFGRWISVELFADDECAVLIPRGVAHGYQCLVDDSTLVYLIDTPEHASSARTIRWDDPTVGVTWPMTVTAISPKDRSAPPWPPEF